MLSIPRDLLVNIKPKEGRSTADAEDQRGLHARQQARRQRAGASCWPPKRSSAKCSPACKLNGIVDVNFAGFIKVVDTLGCAYVNVDHRYYNENVGSPETDYTSINLQPGYQKLCYENALDYVRYRHTDTDFVRVARQQDFLRDLREQISPSNITARSKRSPRPSARRSRRRSTPRPAS